MPEREYELEEDVATETRERLKKPPISAELRHDASVEGGGRKAQERLGARDWRLVKNLFSLASSP